MAYPTAVNDQITDAVSISSVKSIAEQPAMLANLAFANLISNTNMSQQNAVSNQQAMNQIGITVTGKVVNMLTSLSPVHARAASELFSGNSPAALASDGGASGNGAPSNGGSN